MTMTFPEQKFDDMSSFARAYVDRLSIALNSVDHDLLAMAASIIDDAYVNRRTIFSCGNGGSAAIANHLHCDHLKGCQTDTPLRPKVVSLSSFIETITAIANDISYDDVFVYQLRTLADPGDVLITVSSSGDSENVVRAASWAREAGVKVISMTGFTGGRVADLADCHIHVEGDNYGVIEDSHQAIMHMLAQYVRLQHMPEDVVPDRKF